MKAKFKIGDKVVVNNAQSASSVGYLGTLRRVLLVKQSDETHECMYYTESVIGSGGAWFYDSELTNADKL